MSDHPTLNVPIIGTNPDTLGELLREMTFVGEGYGCYVNFDVRRDAAPLPHATAKRILIGDDPEDWADYPDDTFSGYVYVFDGLIVEAYWYWDGDGTLVFRLRSGALSEPIRTIGNGDCKKSYGWVDWPEGE